MSFYYSEPFLSLDDVFSLPFLIGEHAHQRALGDRDTAAGSGRQLQHRKHRNRSNVGTSENQVLRAFQPRMDIHENAEVNVLTATVELPGMKKEDATIDVRNNRLIIAGETTIEKEVNEQGYAHRERQVGKFSRTLPLPAGTQPTDIKASMEEGVLTVTFQKTSKEQAPQRVTIS